jgi:hypothetical protein
MEPIFISAFVVLGSVTAAVVVGTSFATLVAAAVVVGASFATLDSVAAAVVIVGASFATLDLVAAVVVVVTIGSVTAVLAALTFGATIIDPILISGIFSREMFTTPRSFAALMHSFIKLNVFGSRVD